MTREGRWAGCWGWVFALLLLVSAAMATVPGGDAPVGTVRAFYREHGGVVLVAQLVGLVAAVAFVPFARGLARLLSSHPTSSGWISGTGYGVCVMAVLTAVPVLVAIVVAGNGSDAMLSRLAQASDLADVLLFVAIAAFAGAVARAVEVGWLRVAAAAVAVVAAARAVLLLAGSAALELLAPLAFVVLVAVLATIALIRPRLLVRRRSS